MRVVNSEKLNFDSGEKQTVIRESKEEAYWSSQLACELFFIGPTDY